MSGTNVHRHRRHTTVPTENLFRDPKPASKPRSERDRTDQSELTPIPCQDGAMPWITHFLALINALLADRSRLALENVALGQQAGKQWKSAGG